MFYVHLKTQILSARILILMHMFIILCLGIFQVIKYLKLHRSGIREPISYVNFDDICFFQSESHTTKIFRNFKFDFLKRSPQTEPLSTKVSFVFILRSQKFQTSGDPPSLIACFSRYSLTYFPLILSRSYSFLKIFSLNILTCINWVTVCRRRRNFRGDFGLCFDSFAESL